MTPPTAADLDPRLTARPAATRTDLLGVVIDHHAFSDRACLTCGWTPGPGQRACPSYVVAAAIRAHKPLPGWLAHLAPEVPGAHAPAPAPIEQEQAGLFDLLDVATGKA